MPFTLSLEEPKRFVIRANGALAGADALASLRQILADPRFGEGSTIITIATGVTSAPATDELPSIASAVKELYKRGLAGFVIASQPGFVYGVSRMFAMVAEMMGVRADVTMDEAEGRIIIERMELEAARKR